MLREFIKPLSNNYFLLVTDDGDLYELAKEYEWKQKTGHIITPGWEEESQLFSRKAILHWINSLMDVWIYERQ